MKSTVFALALILICKQSALAQTYNAQCPVYDFEVEGSEAPIQQVQFVVSLEDEDIRPNPNDPEGVSFWKTRLSHKLNLFLETQIPECRHSF